MIKPRLRFVDHGWAAWTATRSPRGFTLIEILLSLVLLMLVLSAAYAGLNLFRRVTVAGRADAERSQLARAIERRISSDVRCVLFRESEPQAEESEEPSDGLETINENMGAAEDPGGTTEGAAETGSSDGTATVGSGSDDEDAITTATPADAYATQSVGVFGDATTLVLHVSKPSRPSVVTPSTSAAATITSMATSARKSDLRSISYFLAVAGAGGLQGAVGNTAAGGTTAYAREQGVQGLARMEGDRLTIQQAEAAGDIDPLAQQATILAEEVTEVRFRYFDGVAWVEQWDSVAMSAVPRAIEVTVRIEVRTSERSEPASALAPAPPLAASDLYRFVVALPVADPTLGMAL